MKKFDSKIVLDELFKIMEDNPVTLPSTLLKLYQIMENKLTEVYECGFNDGSKIDTELYELIKPKKDDKL